MTGKQLTIIRQIYGYDTQQALADALNVHVSTIHLWERADRVSEKARFQLERFLHWNIPSVVNFLESEMNRVNRLRLTNGANTVNL